MKKNSSGARLIVGTAFLAAVVLVGLIIYLKQSNKTAQEQRNQHQQPTLEVGPLSVPPTPPEEDRVYSYSGTIIESNTAEKFIRLSTKYGEKRVLYTSQTTIVMRRPLTETEKQNLPPDDLAKLASQETSYTGTLSVGMSISAESTANIRNQNEFTATKIIIIN